jgi:hypothetical protein
MNLQNIIDQERPAGRPAAVRRMRSGYTVSGAAGSQIVNTASDYSIAINSNNELIQMMVDHMTAINNLLGGMSAMNSTVTWGLQQTGVVEVTVSNVDEGEYDPDFVARVLKADSEPMRTFDNVVDLMEWLERDD